VGRNRVIEEGVYTVLMNCKTGAFTTTGLRICARVRHSDDGINKTEGIIEKNRLSN
jgi:7-keto-8-aminopelargonate synthetase-like enzyme